MYTKSSFRVKITLSQSVVYSSLKSWKIYNRPIHIKTEIIAKMDWMSFKGCFLQLLVLQFLLSVTHMSLELGLHRFVFLKHWLLSSKRKDVGSSRWSNEYSPEIFVTQNKKRDRIDEEQPLRQNRKPDNF